MNRTYQRNMVLLETKEATGYTLTAKEKKQLEDWRRKKDLKIK